MKNEIRKFEPVYCIEDFTPENYKAHFKKGNIYTDTAFCDDNADGEWIYITVEFSKNTRIGHKFSLINNHRYLTYFSKHFITMKESRNLKLKKLNNL